MATASSKSIVERRTEVTLSLSAAEAGTLYAILGKISGPDDGPRGHSSAVRDALQRVMFERDDVAEAAHIASASMSARLNGTIGIHLRG